LLTELRALAPRPPARVPARSLPAGQRQRAVRLPPPELPAEVAPP